MVFQAVRKKIKQEKEKQILEDRVVRFMRKVSELQEEQPKLANRYLKQATKIYHGELGSYVPKIDSEFNKHFLSFIKMYPSTVKYNLNPQLA